MTGDPVDLGSGVSYTKLGWYPNRDLNPNYEALHDDDWCGIILRHAHPYGDVCEGAVMFATASQVELNRLAVARGGKDRPMWQVESWDPLTLSPSILQTECGLHGLIVNGVWVGC